jgi:predicted transcriptional regulator
MDDAPPVLHALEAEIMDEMWAREEASVRDVLEALNARAERIRAYTTVMTVMSRLQDKGLLRRRRVGRVDIFRATMPRDGYLEARAEAEVGAIVDEYGDLALAHFARRLAQRDPAAWAELRKLAGDD